MGKSKTAAGFVGINTGVITNCYSSMYLRSNKSYGFCAKNAGVIEKSFSDCRVKGKEVYGFTESIKNVKGSFFDVDRAKEKVKNKKHADESKESRNILAVHVNDLTEDFFKKNEWDIENVWNIKKRTPKFIISNFSKENSDFKEHEEEYIKINNKDELLEFCKHVNQGDENYMSAKAILMDDINLQKAEWEPIGKDETLAFHGVFDGNGHKITNYVIKENSLEYVGFFGVCQNAKIMNLSLDCMIHAKGLIGAFVSVSDKSEISCCRIAVDVQLKSSASAFVARNSGTIDRCCAVGKVSEPLIVILLPLWLALGGTALIAVSLPFISNMINPNKNDVYPAITPDPYVEKSEENGIGGDGENSVNLSFKKKITAPQGSGKATMHFANPNGKNINQYVVVTLQLTDEELIKKIGKTGRKAEDQAKYDSAKNYDPVACRVEIAKTGAILPGYKLDTIVLNHLPDGTELPNGEYDAVLYFEMYDLKTNEKSSMNSQSAIRLIIGGDNA